MAVLVLKHNGMKLGRSAGVGKSKMDISESDLKR